VLEAVSLHDGFVLLPVEVPSADVARALCAWLERQARPVRVVAPAEGGWDKLPAELVAAPAGVDGIVVAIGPREVTADLRAGLRLLNQRRDTVAAHLGGPLLWCGPRPFLEATWELAPDFWSIRELPLRMEPPALVRDDTQLFWFPERQGIRVSGLKKRLEAARFHGDKMNAARLALRLAYEMAHSSKLEKLEDAETLAREALAVFDEMRGVRAEAGLAKETLGDIARARQDLGTADARYAEALTVFERLGDGYGIARVANVLGDAALKRGDLERALGLIERALAASAETGDPLARAKALRGRGDVHRAQGDLESAERDYDLALPLFRIAQDRFDEAAVLELRGALRSQQDRLTDAMHDYDRALQLYKDERLSVGQVAVLHARGNLHRKLGDQTSAARDYVLALQISRKAGWTYGQAMALRDCAELEIERQDYASALPLYLEAHDLYRGMGDDSHCAVALANIAAIHYFSGRIAEARSTAEEALALATKAGNTHACELAELVLSFETG
jgi:tetratricopeptide (TPR) repeat protein